MGRYAVAIVTIVLSCWGQNARHVMIPVGSSVKGGAGTLIVFPGEQQLRLYGFSAEKGTFSSASVTNRGGETITACGEGTLSGASEPVAAGKKYRETPDALLLRGMVYSLPAHIECAPRSGD